MNKIDNVFKKYDSRELTRNITVKVPAEQLNILKKNHVNISAVVRQAISNTAQALA